MLAYKVKGIETQGYILKTSDGWKNGTSNQVDWKLTYFSWDLCLNKLPSPGIGYDQKVNGLFEPMGKHLRIKIFRVTYNINMK